MWTHFGLCWFVVVAVFSGKVGFREVGGVGAGGMEFGGLTRVRIRIRIRVNG